MAMLHLVGLQTEKINLEEASTNSEITRNTQSFGDVNELFMRSSDNVIDCTERGERKPELSLDVGFLPVSRSMHRKALQPNEDMVTDPKRKKNKLQKRNSRSLSPSKTTGGTESSATIMSEIDSTNPSKGPYVRKISESHSFKESNAPTFREANFHQKDTEIKEEDISIQSPSLMQQFTNGMQDKTQKMFGVRRNSKESAGTNRSKEASLLGSIDSRLYNLISNRNETKDEYADTQMEEGRRISKQNDATAAALGSSYVEPDQNEIYEKPRMIQTKSKSSIYSNISSLKNSHASYDEDEDYDQNRLPSHAEQYDGDIDEVDDGNSRSGLSVDFPKNKNTRNKMQGNSSNDEHQLGEHGPIHKNSHDNLAYNAALTDTEENRENGVFRESLRRSSSITSYFSSHSVRFASKLTRESSRKSIAKRRKSHSQQELNDNVTRSDEKKDSDEESDDVQFFGWGDEEYSSSEEEQKEEEKNNINDSYSDDEDDLIFGFANNAAALRAKARREETMKMQMEEEYDSKRPWRKPPPPTGKGTEETKKVENTENSTTLSVSSDKSDIVNEQVADNESVVSEADSIEIAQSIVKRFEKFRTPASRASSKRFTLMEAFSEGEENDISDYQVNMSVDIEGNRTAHKIQYDSSDDEDSKTECDTLKPHKATADQEESSYCTSDEDLLVGFGTRSYSPVQSTDCSDSSLDGHVSSRIGSPVSQVSTDLPKRSKQGRRSRNRNRNTVLSTSSSDTHGFKFEENLSSRKDDEKKNPLNNTSSNEAKKKDQSDQDTKGKNPKSSDGKDNILSNNISLRSDLSNGSNSESTPMIAVKLNPIRTGDGEVMRDSIVAESEEKSSRIKKRQNRRCKRVMHIFIFLGLCGIAGLSYVFIYFKDINQHLAKEINEEILRGTLNSTKNAPNNTDQGNLIEKFNESAATNETKNTIKVEGNLNETILTNLTQETLFNTTNIIDVTDDIEVINRTIGDFQNATTNTVESNQAVLNENSITQTFNISSNTSEENTKDNHSELNRRREHNTTMTIDNIAINNSSDPLASVASHLSNTSFIHNSNISWQFNSTVLENNGTSSEGNDTLQTIVENVPNNSFVQQINFTSIENNTKVEGGNSSLEKEVNNLANQSLLQNSNFSMQNNETSLRESENDEYHVENDESISEQGKSIGDVLEGTVNGDRMGTSISISSDGKTLAAGAPHGENSEIFSGYVNIYTYISEEWVLSWTLHGSVLGGQFGLRVSLSGNGQILSVTALKGNSNDKDNGLVQVYRDSGNGWVKLGNDIKGTDLDLEGFSCELSNDGSHLVTGAIGFASTIYGGMKNGRVRIFRFDNMSSTWNQLGQDLQGTQSFAFMGQSVSISETGNIIALGSFEKKKASVTGYKFDGVSWMQLGPSIVAVGTHDALRIPVSLSRDGQSLGICTNEVITRESRERGECRIYRWEHNSWDVLGNKITLDDGDEVFGRGIQLTMNGKRIAISSKNLFHDKFSVRFYDFHYGKWEHNTSIFTAKNNSDSQRTSFSMSGNGSVLAFGSPGIGSESGELHVFKNGL